ncbi:nucleotidyltransferase family protein [Labrenzia sp. DG1229]|uniref:nucleotidyltransferase family protein n=1 Tax=Labrenzia sp. DG1229 TaxID=681847 RepID=UPI00048A736C|nr:nucleotidyltransferase family protein [Labrenzia sp. DG1229]
MKPLDKEQRLLVALCKATVLNQDFKSILAETYGLDMAHLFRLASKQKILPILASYLVNSDCRDMLIDVGLDGPFYDAITLSRMRNRAQREEVIRIQNELEKRGLRNVPRKGVVYSNGFYPEASLRVFKDIDFYVDPGQETLLLECLKDLGYEFGYFSRKTKRISPLERKREIIFRLYPTHLLPMARISGLEYLPAYKLDLSVTLAWHDAAFDDLHQSILNKALTERNRTDWEGIRSADRLFHFVDCCLHLFREAFFEDKEEFYRKDAEAARWIGVNLRKFLDVALIWRTLSAKDLSALNTYTIDRDFAAVMSWVGFHLEALFGVEINRALDLDLRQIDPPLWKWKSGDGRIKNWRGSMMERIFAEDPAEVFIR